MNALVACEESQRVCTELRKLGVNAFSCDIQECSGGHPEWHIMQDVLPLLHPPCEFQTVDGCFHRVEKWDLLIAHPPCTYLTVSGNRWFDETKYGEKAVRRKQERERAIQFFLEFVDADCTHIAIENPIGVISTVYRKPDCIIQPWMFGHPIRKATCLWLKNLPPLQPTNVVEENPTDAYGFSIGGSLRHAVDENGKIISWNDPRTAKLRSKTYPGIAEAMAKQWVLYIVDEMLKEA